MINPDLTPDQTKCANAVLEWVNRMNAAYGPSVTDKNGNKMDWGQALCREAYGENWPQYIMENNVVGPDQDVLTRAIEWEEGDIPDWVVYQDSPVEDYMKYSWDGITRENGDGSD